MMLEFRQPIPVHTPHGEGLAIYVESGGGTSNDVWCVMTDDGRIRHYLTSDLQSVGNGTYGIASPDDATSASARGAAKLAAKVVIR